MRPIFLLGLVLVLCLIPAVWSTTAAERKASAAEIVLCSYNLKNWLVMDRFDGEKTVLSAPKPEAEKQKVVSIIAAIHPDILGICEIGTEDDLRDLQARLKAAGLDLPNIEFSHGGDEHRSLALLTHLPIQARNSQKGLKYQIGGVEFPFQRGILDVTVRVAEDFNLHCLGVHLKSKRDIPEADQEVMRRNEARLLRAHIDGILATDANAKIVAYGDFNEDRNGAPISEVMGSRNSPNYMEDLLIKDINGEVWTHFWDSADAYSRFDYFFMSRSLRPYVDFKRSFVYSSKDFDKASDHRPIVMRFGLETVVNRNKRKAASQ